MSSVRRSFQTHSGAVLYAAGGLANIDSMEGTAAGVAARCVRTVTVQARSAEASQKRGFFMAR